jgi:hypothetical protein
VLAWERFHNSAHDSGDYGAHVALDAQGNAYITGTSNVPGDRGDTDVTTAKYSPAGELLWSKTFAGAGAYKDWATGIAVDAQGNAYVTGSAWRGSAYWYDLVTVKYAPDGAEQWVRYHNGPLGGSDHANAVALDADGNAVVTGYESTRDQTTSRSFDQFVTVKYAPDGTTLWTAKRSTAQLGDHAVDVAVDAAGNSYVTGFAWTAAGGNESRTS